MIRDHCREGHSYRPGLPASSTGPIRGRPWPGAGSRCSTTRSRTTRPT